MDFSRRGLIEQLSSDAGDGYDVADATAAVDSLDVDWNEQAARSARQYLDISGFSCDGLIEQLSSSSGDQYTKKPGRVRGAACWGMLIFPGGFGLPPQWCY
ncbi:Ltp family lipoprotein [Novosphingobium colocasiae]